MLLTLGGIFPACAQGQTKIADHLRKSYSMSDLSGDPQRKFQREESEDIDDETGDLPKTLPKKPPSKIPLCFAGFQACRNFTENS